MAKASCVIQGTSGATVDVRSWGAIKSTTDTSKHVFLYEQAVYMSTHGTPFAVVLWVRSGAYATQALRPLQLKTPLDVLLRHARASLRPLWARPAVPASGWAVALAAYIERLCVTMPSVRAYMLTMLDRVAYRPGTLGVTHGDATLDNVMRNDYEELTWFDPIPYRADIPPLIGVDLGKLLQSACGYEQVKYGQTSNWSTPTHAAQDVVLTGMSEDDVFSARFFHRLAYLRGLRYFTGPVLQHAYNMIEELTEC